MKERIQKMSKLAWDLEDRGKYEDAEKCYSELLPMMEEVVGQDHPNTLGSKCNYAATLTALKKYEEAEKIYVEVIKKSEEVLGANHPRTLAAKGNYANTLRCLMKFKEAGKIEQEVIRK